MSAHEHQLTRLLEWYAAHRDDEWEHQHGIKLEPLDFGNGRNGWSLIVDTKGTDLASLATSRERIARSQTDCLAWHFEPGAFRATVGPRNLSEAIGKFFDEIERLAEQQQRS